MSAHGWHGLVGTYHGVVILAVAALPLAMVTMTALARRRVAAGNAPAWAWRTALIDVCIVYGTVPFVWMTLLPGPRAGEVTGAVSLVPLRDLATMSTFQIVGNLLIFAALGFLVPLRFAALATVTRMTALAGVLSALIETAQYVLRLDRVSSVDDVLLNAAGGGLAALGSVSALRLAALQRTTRSA